MTKEKRILSYFLGWLIVGFIVCFVGIKNTYADTYYMNYQYTQQYYDNNGSSVSEISTTWNESMQSYISGNITTAAGSYGAGISISSPIPIISNHTYTLSIYFEDISNIAKSSKNKIAIGNSLYGASYNYANGDFWCDTIQGNVSSNKILQFVFKANGPANFIFIPWTTTSTVTQSYVLTQVSIDDLGSSGVSQTDINNSLANQTNVINNSIQNSTNTITGAITDTENNITNSITDTENNINQNIDDMEQSIIDSNKETQDVIKDQFNSCRPSVNLFDISKVTNTSTITNQGDNLLILKSYFNNSGKTLSELAPELKAGTTYILYLNTSNNSNQFIYLIGSNKSWIRGNTMTISQEDLNSTVAFYGTDGVDVVISEIQIQKGNSFTVYEPFGEICNNKIDDTNNKLDGIQGALTDSSAPNTSGLENSAGWLPAGPLDSILNLPLTMLNSLTNSLGKTCAPLNLKLPYVNKNIQIPCLSAIFAQITGVNGLWTWVGTIASVLILYNYLLNLYAWVDRVLTLRAEFDEAMGADMANWGRL